MIDETEKYYKQQRIISLGGDPFAELQTVDKHQAVGAGKEQSELGGNALAPCRTNEEEIPEDAGIPADTIDQQLSVVKEDDEEQTDVDKNEKELLEDRNEANNEHQIGENEGNRDGDEANGTG